MFVEIIDLELQKRIGIIDINDKNNIKRNINVIIHRDLSDKEIESILNLSSSNSFHFIWEKPCLKFKIVNPLL